jgi:hypothetical protein
MPKNLQTFADWEFNPHRCKKVKGVNAADFEGKAASLRLDRVRVLDLSWTCEPE